jgi:hypothetical protein
MSGFPFTDIAAAKNISPVVQDYRKKWAKPSLTTPDRSCMVRIGPDFVRIDPDFVRIDPDHSGSILQ